MKKPKELLSKMLFEANNVANTAETRQNCRDCAEYLETVVLSGVKPKLVQVPFSWFYEAVCGCCGKPLETDDKECSACGMTIDWDVLTSPRKERWRNLQKIREARKKVVDKR